MALAVACDAGSRGAGGLPLGDAAADGAPATPSQASDAGDASANAGDGAGSDAGADVYAGPFAPPDAPGPFAVDAHLGEVASADGALQADYFLPRGPGPYPVVFLRHGYTRGQRNLRGWGERLASHGFATALPSTRDSGSATIGQADLEAVVTFTLARARAAGSFLSGALDEARVVLGGHSSGGLAATLAAAGGHVPVAALVLLDTEAAPEGEAAAPKVLVPSVGAFAEPDTSPGALSCNEQGGGVRTAQALAGPVLVFRAKGASHCDLESETDALCAAACGSTSAARLAAFETYVTAFLQAEIRCDARARPWVDGTVLAGDARVQVLSQRGLGALCR